MHSSKMQIKMQVQEKEKTTNSLSFCSGIVEENKQASEQKSTCLVKLSATLKHDVRVKPPVFNATDNKF